MTASAVAPLAAGDPVRYAALAAMTAILVGVLALLARVARLGDRDRRTMPTKETA